MEVDIHVKALLEEIKRHDKLPAFDRNVNEVCRMANERNTSMHDLAAVILRDAAMTSYILAAANSAAYRVTPDSVKTVSAAVVLLGSERVKSLALGMFIYKQCRDNVKSRDLYRLFTCAYFSGTFTMALARRARVPNAEELFVAGLLHELPRLLLANAFPEKYHELENLVVKEGASLDSACRKVFGVSYFGLACGVAENWNLPENVSSALLASEGAYSVRFAIVREAGSLADMMFGNAPGGAQHLGDLQKRLRGLLKDDSFSLEKLAATICDEDQNLGRFFKLTSQDVGMMVKITEWGKVSAAQVATDLVYGTVIEELEKHAPPPQLLIGHFMTELTLGIRKGANLHEILLLAQEALYKCLKPDLLFAAFVNPQQTHLVGLHYVGADLSVHARDLSVPLLRKDSLIGECFHIKQALRTNATWDRLGLPFAFERLNAKCAILAPVVVFGRPVGLFCILKVAEPAFTEEELSWTDAVAAHVAMSLEQSNQISTHPA